MEEQKPSVDRAGSESKAGCSGGSAGTIYVQFWIANRVLEHHEHPPCLCPCLMKSAIIVLRFGILYSFL